MEDHCLHKGLEVLSDQTISVLHHVCGTNWRNTQTINIRRLESNHKEILLSLIPRRMEVVPNILGDPEKNSV